ncbi:MAG: type II toxin-antitoxin system RelE/ParE family toxin [bacterium]|nr:type II toxin-antitoxin system RelE/ParE family toxin [bacterium]
MSPRSRYSVTITRSAEKELDKLPAEMFERVADAILELEEQPRRPGCKKLRGTDDYRLRVGAYRVLYSIDDDARNVVVMGVGHRRDVYRGL